MVIYLTKLEEKIKKNNQKVYFDIVVKSYYNCSHKGLQLWIYYQLKNQN
jgi:hypothetical protein